MADTSTTFIILPLAQRSVSRQWTREQFSSRDACIAKIYAPDTPDSKENPQIVLFENGPSGQSLVFSPDGRLLGVSKPRSSIAAQAYDLHPDQYIPPPATREPETQKSSTGQVPSTVTSIARTLDELKRRQAIISDYADSLLGRVETKPLIGEQLPPRAVPGLLFDGYCTSIPLFDTKQERIWKCICTHLSHQEQALYFTPGEVQERLEKAQPEADTVDSVSIQQTLDLLVRLGLVVHVIIRDLATDTVERYYRLVTEQDQAEPLEESESR